MAQAGYTPISLYYSTTAAAVPVNTNLANGELAINITDGKLYYKNNSGVVTLLAGATAGPAGGSTTQVQYNSSGVLAGSANMTFDGTTLTAAGFSGPHNGTVGATTASTGAFTTLTTSSTVTLNGGTANGVAYLNGSKVLTSGSALTFDGTNLSTTGSLLLGVASTGTAGEIGLANSKAIRFRNAANSAYLNALYVDGSNNLQLGAGTSDAIISVTGLGEAMRVVSTTGNVLIGTTSNANSDKLVVNGQVYQFQTVNGSSASPVTNGGYLFGPNSSTIYAGMRFVNQILSNNNMALAFYTTSNAGSATERFRISGDGALGIGSTPSYGTAGQVLTSGGSGAAPTWTTVSGGGSQWVTSGTQIYYNTGNVGIGTTSPDTYTDGGKNLTVLSSTASTRANLALVGTQSAANEILGRLNFTNTNSSNTAYRVAMIDGLRGSDNNSGYLTFSTGYTTAASEQVRIDERGRVGINTTAATTNLARLQIDHSASSDRYGIYVPGGAYVGSGPSGTQYGGYFSNHTSNSASAVIAVAGVISNSGSASTIYGGYFDGGGQASFVSAGVYAFSRQTDNGGPGTAMGGHFVVTTPNPSAGGSGNMYAVRAENQANKGSTAYGVYSTTLPGANNILGYTYEHNGSLMFRVKANGGIDNFSANNSNLSDRREKKDFAPAKSYLETICAIPVQTFKYINQTDDLPNLGVVAQDVQAVAPEFVAESNWARHDEEPKMRLSVYETDLVYALMKSIQELNAKFEEYKASHP